DRLVDRHRGDVDDAAVAALGHAVDDGLDQLDRRDHVLRHAFEERGAVELAEILGRRTTVVVDQNVDLREGRKQRLLPLRCRDVGGGLVDLHAEAVADFAGRFGKGPGVATVDHEIAAGLGERHGAAASETTARCANDCLPATNAEIHAAFSLLSRASTSAGRAESTTRHEWRMRAAATCPAPGWSICWRGDA